jgi:hypothetical protein
MDLIYFLGTQTGGRWYEMLLNSVDIDVPFVIPSAELDR